MCNYIIISLTGQEKILNYPIIYFNRKTDKLSFYKALTSTWKISLLGRGQVFCKGDQMFDCVYIIVTVILKI